METQHRLCSVCKAQFKEQSNQQKTLRDEFAMAALSWFLASPNRTDRYYDNIAAASYKMADAMMEARKK